MVFGIYLAVPVKINVYHSLAMGRGLEPTPAAGGGGKGTPLQKLPAQHSTAHYVSNWGLGAFLKGISRIL